MSVEFDVCGVKAKEVGLINGSGPSELSLWKIVVDVHGRVVLNGGIEATGSYTPLVDTLFVVANFTIVGGDIHSSRWGSGSDSGRVVNDDSHFVKTK